MQQRLICQLFVITICSKHLFLQLIYSCMMRVVLLLSCIFSITVISCNNADVKNETIATGKESELRQQVAQYPDSLLLKENLVQYFREKGDYKLALKEADNVVTKDSMNDRFYDIKATLYFEDGDTINAIRAFEKAISINPQPEYIISLGSLYAQTKNPMAVQMADALLHAPSANAQKQALFIKGLYFSSIGEKVKAITFFNACLKLDFHDLFAYREKAICLYNLGKYTTAIDELKKAVAVKNTYDEGYYWMGRCYEKLGDKKQAGESYQQALQIDPDYEEAKAALKQLSN